MVAVLPFHVTTGDSLLGDGFAELLTSEFTGESGAPRALDMGTVLVDWRRSGGRPRSPLPRDKALQLARSLGAGLMTEGSIVGLGRQLTITARLYEVPSGRPLGAATRVQSHADSLDTALRQTASNLLASYGAPYSVDAGARFTAQPEAMRQYLHGLALYRRGLVGQAAVAFERAITVDSTFSQALYRRFWLQFWGVPTQITNERMWAARERLSARERAMVELALGPRFPEPWSIPELVRGAERLAATMGDSPEVVFFVGDEYYHHGATIDLEDQFARARDFMLRAFRVDSQTTTLRHLMDVATYLRDTAFLRRSIPLILKTEDPWRYAYAWIAAAQVGDAATLARLRRELVTENTGGHLNSLAGFPGLQQRSMDELFDLWQSRMTTPEGRRAFETGRASILALQGRFREADSLAQLSPANRNTVDGALLILALSDAAPGVDGDSLARVLIARAPPSSNLQRRTQCALALIRLRRGDSTAVVPVSEQADMRGCLWSISVVRLTQSADFSRAKLAALDAEYRATLGFASRGFEALVLAQAWEKLGDPRRALAAIRLRAYGGNILPSATWTFAEEGRLAAIVGDTAGAIRAYRYHLDYTVAADPVFNERRERIRAELARLTAKQ